MKKYTRREVIKMGSHLAAGAAIGTSYLSLLGCSMGNENITDLPPEAMEPADLKDLKFTVVYDNNHYKAGLKADWGFACLVEGLDHTILFDTGRYDTFLMYNMSALGIDPAQIDDIVISHEHWDHTGGLFILMDNKNPKNVSVVNSMNIGRRGRLANYGASLTEIDSPVMIAKSTLSTGTMRRVLISEQGLIVLTNRGVIVIVGCAHPGIVEMVERAISITNRDVLMVLGGFHLLNSSDSYIEEIVEKLHKMGVKYVAPSHCTGEEARRIFAAGYGNYYLDCGVGCVITAEDLA